MSIIDKLNYLKTTKEMIKDSLNDIGVNVTDSDPFREYPELISSLYDEMPKVTGTGKIVTLAPTKKAKMKIYNLLGNSSQSGTPSPTNPVTVKTVTGSNSIWICNKDILELNDFTSVNGLSLTNYDGLLTLSGTASSTSVETPSNLRTQVNLPGGGYCIKVDEPLSFNIGLHIYYGDGTNEIQFMTSGKNYFTFDASRVVTSYGLYVSGLTSGATYDETFKLRLISFKDAQVFNLDLGSTQLCGIGNFNDYIYQGNDNKWYIKKAVNWVTLQGASGWSGQAGTPSGASRFRYLLGSEYYNDGVGATSTGVYCICDRFIGMSHSDYINGTGDFLNGVSLTSNTNASSHGIELRIDATIVPDRDSTALRNWLSTNKPVLYYVLSEDYRDDIEITNSTLIEQLNNLTENGISFLDETNIVQINPSLKDAFTFSASALKGSE